MAKQPLRVGMHGASGRMGQRIIALMRDDPGMVLAAAIDRPGHPGIGRDAGEVLGLGSFGLPMTSALECPLDVLIDFSTPSAGEAIAQVCGERGIPLVVGTTGFEPEQLAEVRGQSARIPLMISSNYSKGVNLLMKLVDVAARALGDSADIEIVERHHHFKKDAPSGTALRLAEIVAEAIGSNQYAHGRQGIVGERPRGEIGLHALRTGDNPGEHTVVFGLMGECLELSHRALNRDGFARGAIDAARFLAGLPAGLYSMADMLGRS